MRVVKCILPTLGVIIAIGTLVTKAMAAPQAVIVLGPGFAAAASEPLLETYQKFDDAKLGMLLRGHASAIRAVVVPVFRGGECAYPSGVYPFSTYSHSSDATELHMRHILACCNALNIPVWLSLDVLCWRRGDTNRIGAGIFNIVPEMEELPKPMLLGINQTQLYASPANSATGLALSNLVHETALRFPAASGIVLDCGLSDTQSLGFSSAANSACQKALGFQVMDIAPFLDNGVGYQGLMLSKKVRQWLPWRTTMLSVLLTSLRNSYRAVRPSGLVFAVGRADYYKSEYRGASRSGRDWRAWVKLGIVDGVFVIGNWSDRDEDVGRLCSYQKEFDATNHAAEEKVSLIPTAIQPDANSSAILSLSVLEPVTWRSSEWGCFSAGDTPGLTIALDGFCKEFGIR